MTPLDPAKSQPLESVLKIKMVNWREIEGTFRAHFDDMPEFKDCTWKDAYAKQGSISFLKKRNKKLLLQ
jgi:hypothetical protein